MSTLETESTGSNVPQGKQINQNATLQLKSPGPYTATVMGPVDQTYMGRLWVWIPQVSGTDPKNKDKWVQARYLSPFYGVSNLVNPDDPADINNTSQSYGMWFVPPDVGVEVLVIFANNDPAECFWIGCIPGTLMNHMIPGIAHRGTTSDAAPSFDPVTEYNKYKLKGEATPNKTYGDTAVTPTHLVQQSILEVQGLDKDQGRGVTTSSVRRESPSQVYGISTPGPVIKRRNHTPGSGIEYNTVTGRKGGHQFVMDDGDIDGNNQLIRIRSTNGGQVLINDSMGCVYVINQQGTAWVELTNSGKIDVYGKNSISVHSEQDINMTADNNVNILASNSFNLVSPTINIEGVDINVYGKGSHRTKTPNYIISADSFSVNTAGGAGGGNSSSPGTGIRMSSDAAVEIVAEGNMFLQTAANFEQVASGKIILAANGNLALNADGQLQLNGVGGIYEETKAGAGTIAKFTVDVDKDFTGGDSKGNVHPVTGWTGAKNWFDGAADKPSHALQAQRDSGVVDIPKQYSSGIDVSHCPVTPQHEPWQGHETSYKGGGGGKASTAPTGSTSSPTSTAADKSASGSASASASSGASAAASPSSTSPSASAATVASGATNVTGVASTTATSGVSALKAGITSATKQLAPTASVPNSAGGSVTVPTGSSSGTPAGASKTGSSSAPETSTAVATAKPIPVAKSGAASATATVNEPTMTEGMPTAGTGVGYNVPSITAITNVAGAVDYQLSDTLTTMLTEMKIDWKAYSQAMAARLSNGRYEVVNSKGYVGRYTIEPSWLTAIGLTTFSGDITKAMVEDKNNWAPVTEEVAGTNGRKYYSLPNSPQMKPGSLQAFLLDKALQEKMFIDINYENFVTLKKIMAITDTTSKQDIAGYLAVAYMGGLGSPKAGIFTLSSSVSLDTQKVQANQQPKPGCTGNGLVGLITWWKQGGNDPTTVPGVDKLGKNTYSYYLIGSRSQPASATGPATLEDTKQAYEKALPKQQEAATKIKGWLTRIENAAAGSAEASAVKSEKDAFIDTYNNSPEGGKALTTVVANKYNSLSESDKAAIEKTDVYKQYHVLRDEILANYPKLKDGIKTKAP